MNDLERLLREQADALGAIEVTTSAGRTEYRRGQALFATVDGQRAELWLDPEIAEAARRTSATGASPRGPAWVTFSPTVLDEHALDRALAWFVSAWRRAGRDA